MFQSSAPVIVGVCQLTQRWNDDARHLDALGLLAEAGRGAIADTGSPALSAAIDTVAIVNMITWSYRDAPADVCKQLGLQPSQTIYTSIGGNTPQYLVNCFAAELEVDPNRVVLLCGAEAGYSARKVTAGVDLGWPPIAEPERIDGDTRLGSSDVEMAYDLALPAFVYPFFETTIRAARGRTPAEHAAALGALYSRFSHVASTNPYAWSRQALSAAEISTVTADNRIIGYPYTKRMNANMAVDQGAAVVLTTAGRAAELGIDEALWVYPMGGAHLNDVWEFTRRPRLDESPAIRESARLALAQAGLDLQAIDVFDLYSCFPCAVQIASTMIGIAPDDPRDLTVTGGLSYFGGPGNNYSMHAIATVVERIRARPEDHAMVTALGWFLTKHAIGIYGKQPSAMPWAGRSFSAEQATIDDSASPPPITVTDGDVTVEAFMIRHQRDGAPRRGVVLGRTSNGERTLAEIDATADELTTLEENEIVGRLGRCRHDVSSGLNRIRFA